VDVENLAAKPGEDGVFRQGLQNIKMLAENCVNQARNMALLLRPSMLDDLGLVAALEWQAREVSRQSQLLVTVSAEGVPDDLPESLRRKDLVAGFEYFGQPNSLMARVVARNTRVSVEPQYTYHVAAERTDLEARLKYTIRGARLYKLDLDIPGWEIDSPSSKLSSRPHLIVWSLPSFCSHWSKIPSAMGSNSPRIQAWCGSQSSRMENVCF